MCPPHACGCAGLAVKDVDFTFPSEPQKQILHKLSFVADAGSKVAFVGATGCGKSTSIQIIQRFYAQSSGQVLLDGRDIEGGKHALLAYGAATTQTRAGGGRSRHVHTHGTMHKTAT